MSKVHIHCIKGFEKNKTKNNDARKDNELTITANQLFMNTEKFFNSVKENLKDYFDIIEKK